MAHMRHVELSPNKPIHLKLLTEVNRMNGKHYKTYIKVGLNILHYRKERGLTQEMLAEMTNYSRNHIQKIETAAAVPSVDALLDIAQALEIPPCKLLEFKD